MAFTRVLLPQPERQNSAPPPGVGSSKHASSEKDPRLFLTATLSINVPTGAAPGVRTTLTTIGHQVLRQTRCRPSAPRRYRRPAFAEPCIAPGVGCAALRECSTTKCSRQRIHPTPLKIRG